MKKLLRLMSVLTMVAVLALPVVALAGPYIPGGGAVPANFGGGFAGCTGTGATFNTCALAVIQILLAVVFIIAVIFLIIGGFRYLTSGGNEESVEKAKGTITNAIIGIVVILLAWIIVSVIVNLTGGNVG